MENQEKKLKEQNKDYPENGRNFKAGKEETGALPNNPAENAERTAPEEDSNKSDNLKKKKH